MKNGILIVSDNFTTCANLFEDLEANEFKICFTADFNDAMKEIKNNKKYLIVIIDMDNPIVKKKDLKHIKQFIKKGMNKIILIVNDISDNALNECLEILHTTVIKKPFDIEDFLISVKMLSKT